ncbi:MAG: sensor histidine kinase [Solirubrobacterales bacterium]
MEKRAKTIKKRIFSSHMAIIGVCITLTLVVFVISFRIFIRRETKLQITAASKILTETISENFNKTISNKDYSDAVQDTLEVENALKQVQNYSTINYALLDENKNVISLKQNKNQDNFVNNKLIPTINKNKLNNFKENTKSQFLISILRSQYEVSISPIKLEDGTKRYLIVYSDLEKSRSLTRVVIIMLVLILLVTALIASIISSNVSNRISMPINKLIKYAKKVGDRDYNTEYEKFDEDEIGELAETMHSMAQKLSAYDNTIKTFLQNASHELRTPLMSIQGYAEGIKYGVVDEEEKAVDIIIDESKRLSSLVDDLLYLSKIDAMQDNFKCESINVEELLKSSIEKVRGIALSSEKTIIFANEAKEDLIIQGDKDKLIRAIINILGNCLRYCNKNIDVVESKIEGTVVIEIYDDGPGFDKETLAHVFERFYKGKNGNYGLGLAITKSIIKKHRGSIEAKNNQAGGALFRIILKG